MACETIGCARETETRIDVVYPDGTGHSDHVCGRCARRYIAYSGTSMVDYATVTWTLAPWTSTDECTYACRRGCDH